MVVLGRISAPYGVKGWVKVQAYADDPLAWRAMPLWWVGEDGRWKALRLAGCRAHSGTLIARFEGIEDRDAAAALAGALVAAPREALPQTGAGEYYWADLIGLRAVAIDGTALGRVESLIDSGAHAVLCVRDGERERLVPFVAAVVREVDVTAGEVRLDWQADW